MKKYGEWGENFPIAISAFGYNETTANERFPMERQDVLAKGWKWSDREKVIPDVKKIIPAQRLPRTIEEVPDDILNWAIQCEKTQRPYRIIALELDFYRKLNIPIPRLHPEVRHERRSVLRSPHLLWRRNCQKCNAQIDTPYGPDTPNILYCEACFLAETYGEDRKQLLGEASHDLKTGYQNLARKANAAKLLIRAKRKKEE